MFPGPVFRRGFRQSTCNNYIGRLFRWFLAPSSEGPSQGTSPFGHSAIRPGIAAGPLVRPNLVGPRRRPSDPGSFEENHGFGDQRPGLEHPSS